MHEILGFLFENALDLAVKAVDLACNALDLIWGLFELLSTWWDGPSASRPVTPIRPPGA
jgi:hypothetical protein